MKIKCKQCELFIERICSHFKRGRASGKKRDCLFAVPKPVKPAPYARYLRFISKEERRKMKLKQIEDREKAKAMQKEMEQKRLLAASMQDIKVPREKVAVKKPSIFKRLFRRTGGK